MVILYLLVSLFIHLDHIVGNQILTSKKRNLIIIFFFFIISASNGSNGKDDCSPSTHLLLTSNPNVEQKICDTEVIHKYTSDSSVYKIRTAFELRVRTQALCGVELSDEAGAASLSNQMWTTKEAGACVLSALLIRLEREDN